MLPAGTRLRSQAWKNSTRGGTTKRNMFQGCLKAVYVVDCVDDCCNNDDCILIFFFLKKKKKKTHSNTHAMSLMMCKKRKELERTPG